ncbi:putative F-box protein [Capsicum baccatum]|uniref:F-box protein n=1 Tax=Capsicum baccatum TaxID=33114 RepID=A0A2G2X126_CAPBA|nr:putative F-box protein [Capsicum baccatum]
MSLHIGIIPGGKVILPLLALGGIAVWINYYYRKRTRSNQEEVDDTKEDHLSKLPDDVLSSILGNLTVRDAARTSILSTRWKYLFASMPALRFKCRDMFGDYTLRHDCVCYTGDQLKFIIVLYKFLELYSGRRVAQVELDCCFAGTYPARLSSCVRCISR